MIVTSITKPENAVAGTLWRKEKTGEVRMSDGKGGWVTPTPEVLAHHGLASNPVEAKREEPLPELIGDDPPLTPEQIEALNAKFVKKTDGSKGGAK